MHFRRLLALVSVGLIGLLGVASPAAAQEYGEQQNFLSASSNTVCVGETVSFAAGYFESGANVEIDVDGNNVGSATANSEGVATFPLTFNSAGTYQVSATGPGEDGTVRVSTRVTARDCDDGDAGAGDGARPGQDGVTFGAPDSRGTDAAATRGGLPRTGTDIVSIGLVAGGVLVLVGAVLVGTMARRRGTGIA
jgi:LPXTG-motif cell wall-anchored protein